jgi:hypothetical protein
MPLRLHSASKYRNEPVHADGYRFDSKAEAARWAELRLLEKAGEITDLRRQVPIDLTTVNRDGERVSVGRYIADFSYCDTRRSAFRWEDVKGFASPLSLWKIRHVKAEHGIEVEIVRMGR